ncbi:MAG: DNA ligase [Piscinibacter sp.]|uniref:DNA ligase n=1 Tax=Piscinibacter sp. TaxID=1903157 RepID=UPI001B5C0724|nr:DNA ligase [Piscinibacter sp.]MBP5990442.1 DNA ligase [Piscinibacter sp.]MBP6028841.1 DNA ligase [Piscinibacter sp.]
MHFFRPNRRQWLALAAAAPALVLAEQVRPGLDPAGWLVSEKLDGVRALWDGRQLRFRSGRVVAAPAGFLARLPRTPLDGELWLARGRFDELSGLVRRASPDDALWREVRYMLFELPGAPGPFAERARALERIAEASRWPQLQAVPQCVIASRAALATLLADTVREGGEGLMLHRADALYEAGRSRALVKLKPQQDEDAVVIGHLPGRGRHAGRLGALQLRRADGLVFQLGTGFSDAQRSSPPPLGSTVTYTYRGLTPGGAPRFASFLRVRPDA